MKQFSLLLFLICFGSFHTTGAQEIIDRKDGLSGNSISSIIQDCEGFIWIATKNGLNRFDSRVVKIYETNSSKLIENDISDLLLVDEELYAAGTSGHIYHYLREIDDFELVTTIDANINTINYLSGQFLVGSSKGLFNLEIDKKQLNPILATARYNIQDIEYLHSQIYLATFGDGLIKYSNNRLTKIENSPPFILDIEIGIREELFIGSQGEGILKYEISKNAFNSIIENSNASIVRKIANVKEGLLIGTEGHGLIKLDLVNSSKTDDIISDMKDLTITDVIVDATGNIWIGTAWDGVLILPSEINSLKHDINLSVLSIYGQDDYLLLGTDGDGLWRYNPESRNLVRLNTKTDFIQKIYNWGSESNFLGTYSDGIVVTDRNFNVIESYQAGTDSLSLLINDVRDFDRLKNENLIVSTWGGGLSIFNPKSGTFSNNTFNSKKEKVIYRNIIDTEKVGNDLFISSSFGDGLLKVKYSDSKLIINKIDTKGILPMVSNLLCLKRTSDSLMWIGSWDQGLYRYNLNSGRLVHYDQNKTLGRKTFVSIEEDNDGNMWFGTKNGVLLYEKAKDQFNSFKELSGEYHIKSSFKESNGMLHFGHTKGLTSFNPKILKTINDSLIVRLSDIKIFGFSIYPLNNSTQDYKMIDNQLWLNYDQDIITFYFSALAFPKSNWVSYDIKLEGFEDKWRNIGNRNFATYTNLSSGDYSFNVRARKNDNIMGEYSLKVIKATPPWLTWWAFLIYLIMLAVAIIIIIRSSMAWQRIKNNLLFEKISHQKDIELHNTKQRFFINISHEIRTPITVILNALKGFGEPNSKSEKRAFDSIRKNGNHLINLVNEILDYRKIEAEKLILNISEYNIKEFIEEIYIAFRSKAKDEEVELIVELTDKQIDLWFDSFQLEKVFFNIITNSFKSVSKGDKIKLTVIENNDDVDLIISDTGSGMTEETKALLFERFYQVNEYKGYGIGLSIVKDIITLHGAKIFVESEIDQGSTFTVRIRKGSTHFENKDHIRFLTSSVNKLEVKRSELSDLQETSILIVEDNVEIRNHIGRLFNEVCQVNYAGNGIEAMEFAIRELPDIIISDILMPKMDGIELTESIKRDIRTSHIPIILLTARAGVVFENEGLESGADAYISKPFDDQLLITRVLNLIKGRRKLWEKFSLYFADNEYKPQRPNDEFLNNVKVLIKENIMEDDLNPEFLSKELGMSHSVIYRKLKQITGLSIVEFIREFKLNIAKDLLFNYNYSVKETCFKSGFSDRRYFSKVFKARFGKLPSEYKSKSS